jgi:methionyl-tRNA formyltransferase
MRVVFMGTPDAAVPTLRAVAKAFEVVCTYTRPDKPKGRGLHVDVSPVKAAALELGVEVRQPKGLKNEADNIRALEPDVLLVVAYGAILRPDVLEIPRLGPVNVHFSLLPRWRGAAPVERAICAGDTKTGVTTMLMDEGLDTGPMLLVEEEEIRPDDTSGTLRARLADRGADLAVRTLLALDRGDLEPTTQPDEGMTYAEKIDPAEAHLDPSGDAAALERKVRAFDPSPGTFVTFRGKRLKGWRAALHDGGVVLPNGLHLIEVQPEGKKRMSGEAFANGYRPVASDFA